MRAATLVGPQDYRNLVLCWDRHIHVVREAIERLGRNDTAMLHYSQVYPLYEGTADYMTQADRDYHRGGQCHRPVRQARGAARRRAGRRVAPEIQRPDFRVEELVEGLTGFMKDGVLMEAKLFDMGDIDIAWCPGCGNYPILKTLKEAVAELDIDPTQLVMVSGIGQAAKIPHYLRAHVFNGLHGRALPAPPRSRRPTPGSPSSRKVATATCST